MSSQGKNKLTIKQEKFCHAYMETGNASEAYRQSYNCGNMKPETINRRAKDLTDHSKIKARMQFLQDELKHTSDITKERILFELEAILEANISDYLDFDGKKVTFKSFKELTSKQLRAIEGIKQNEKGEVKGKYGNSVNMWEIKGGLSIN